MVEGYGDTEDDLAGGLGISIPSEIAKIGRMKRLQESFLQLGNNPAKISGLNRNLPH